MRWRRRRSEWRTTRSTPRSERLQEILSYAMARILVSCVADGFLIRRYAMAESKTMYERLQTESPRIHDGHSRGTRASRRSRRATSVTMHFAEFLRLTSGIRSKEWKLVNTEVQVQAGSRSPTVKFARVLEQALPRSDGGRTAAAEVARWMLDNLKGDVANSQPGGGNEGQYQAERFGEVDVECFPPCIRACSRWRRPGENLSHIRVGSP